jgi:predicted regulator of Ras-like GTPase activity (Roadblock/LC7/MglB family)
MQDVLAHDGVTWVALIGPDALPIDFLPGDSDVDSAVAMWVGLDALLEDTPAKMLVRTNGALMLSQRVDEDRLLLTLADLNVNIGKLRSTLSEVAERIIDLD